MRIPAIQVPVVDPRSRSTKPLFSATTSQWAGDTDASSMARSASWLHPTTTRASLETISVRVPHGFSSQTSKRRPFVSVASDVALARSLFG
jgi:hypothetical protein